MNNDQKIIDAINYDAKQEEERIIHLANEEAEKVIAEAKAQAERENAPIIEKAKQLASEVIAKEISSAEMEAKKTILSQKQALLSETVSAAKSKLNGLNSDKYKEVISKMISSVNISGATVIVSEKDKADISDIFTEKGFIVSDETRNIKGGFIVKKGDIEYNYTFDSIFSASKEQIEETAAKILFN
jgi:V/A-type H+-transporting ATPase subunit E